MPQKYFKPHSWFSRLGILIILPSTLFIFKFISILYIYILFYFIFIFCLKFNLFIFIFLLFYSLFLIIFINFLYSMLLYIYFVHKIKKINSEHSIVPVRKSICESL